MIVFDDDAEACALYVQALVGAGFTVRFPGVDEDVLAVVGTLAGPVAVVIDVAPREPRAVLAQQLATLRPRPALIAVAGRSRHHVSYADLFDAYLLRPCLPDAMVAAVRQALRARP